MLHAIRQRRSRCSACRAGRSLSHPRQQCWLRPRTTTAPSRPASGTGATTPTILRFFHIDPVQEAYFDLLLPRRGSWPLVMVARARRMPLSLMLLPPWLVFHFGDRLIVSYIGTRPVLGRPPFRPRRQGSMLSLRRTITIVTPWRRTVITEVSW